MWQLVCRQTRQGRGALGTTGGTPALLTCPWIYQAQAAAVEVGSVAGGQDGATGTGDRGNLRIQCCYGTALRAARGGYFRKSARGFFVEGQDATGKVLC